MATDKNVTLVGLNGEPLSVTEDMKWKCVTMRLREALGDAPKRIDKMLSNLGQENPKGLTEIQVQQLKRDKVKWLNYRDAYIEITGIVDTLIAEYGLS